MPQFPQHVSGVTQSWVAPGAPAGAGLWPPAPGWRWPGRLLGWASSREWWPGAEAGTAAAPAGWGGAGGQGEDTGRVLALPRSQPCRDGARSPGVRSPAVAQGYRDVHSLPKPV